MESKNHMRGKTKTMSLCGLGCEWPSTIALRDDAAKVNCQQCIHIIENSKLGVDESEMD